MFGWWRGRKRKRLAARELPTAWALILERNAYFAADYDDADLQRFVGCLQVLVAEKNWEGCGGLVLSDEHRVTIAAQIARISVALSRARPPQDANLVHEYFDETRSVLVYPEAYVARSQDHVGSGVVVEGNSGRLGEAWYRGPVILAWRDVLKTVRGHNYGRNVVIHEFAHQLDMRNGSHADGVPVIESAEFSAAWTGMLRTNFERLQELCRSGQGSLLDCYGATNPSEFFAVCSEVYFELPERLRLEWPEVHQLLDRFYRG